MQDCDFVPDQCRSRDGDPKDQFTQTNVLLTIYTEFVFDDFAHGTKGRDILSQPIAQAVCFPKKEFALLDVVNEQKKAGPASENGSQYPAHGGHRTYWPDLI